ncbi:MAG TPA: RdgB/HAM1 family non-canonical purine NTP pyrophosphatase [Acidimicrobiia bacterium]|nr:RdgB/HAM1 family non-canonical purine NTP pyrophosphatase [Acidimicrobiia bacterium]
MIPRLVVASKNPDKIAEIESLLTETGLTDEVVRDLDWPDVLETGATLAENAVLKARVVVDATGLPSLADDTGLEVDALNGAPGVHTARFAGEGARYEDNVSKLLEVLDGRLDRAARFRTVVALVFPDGVEVTADGLLEGVITDAARGTAGFGYDPVFEVDAKTLSEMSADEKNQLSHRARAIRALAASLGL